MNTLFTKLLRILLATILLVILFVYLLISTQMGLRWTLYTLNGLSRGTLIVGSGYGRLGSYFVLRDVRMNINHTLVTINTLELRWFPAKLIQRKLAVDSAIAHSVNIYIPNNFLDLPATRTEELKWLRALNLKLTSLNDINIYYQNQRQTHINQINIVNDENNINHLEIKLPEGTFRGKYTLAYTDFLSWQLNLSAHNVNTNYLWKNTDARINFSLSSTGEWRDNLALNLLITNLSGSLKQYPIKGIVKLSYQDNSSRADMVDLQIGPAFIKFYGNTDDPWNLVWNIHIPNLQAIYPFTNGTFYSKGTIVTRNNVSRVDATILGNSISYKNTSIANIRGTITSNLRRDALTQVNLNLNNIRYKNYVIAHGTAIANTQLTPKRIRGNTNITLSNINQIHGTFFIPNILQKGTTAETIGGQFNFKLGNINQFVKYQHIQNLSGDLRGVLQLQGTLKTPRYAGVIRLVNGSFRIPLLGIQVSQINLLSNFNDSLLINTRGNFRSGPGTASFESLVRISDSSYPLNIHLIGSNLQVANTDEVKILASPNVTISLNGITRVSGLVYLPMVHITAQEYVYVVHLPDETIFVGQAPKRRYFSNMDLRLRLQLGDDIYLAYKNLEANLAGNVMLFQVPGGLPAGNGELRVIRGTYKLYDKVFSIDDGRLIYAGNLLVNPGLNIRAIQRISNQSETSFLGIPINTASHAMNVGVAVRGTLEEPVVTLISDPPMSQDDILAYIVYGQSRSNITAASQLSLLASLTSNLNLEGPSESGLASPPSSGLFGIFKMGLFNPTQVLNFNLPLTRYWKLRTEASINETSVDLLYDYETDY